MAKLTKKKISWINGDGKKVEGDVDVFVTSSGEFQIEIPDELAMTARAVDNAEDEKSNNAELQGGARTSRIWHRRDCARRTIESRNARRGSGKPGPEMSEDSVWRICSKTMKGALLGIRDVASKHSEIPDIVQLVIVYQMGASAQFYENEETGDVVANWRYNAETKKSYEHRVVDTTVSGRNGFYQKQPGPVAVEFRARLCRHYTRPQKHAGGDQYRFEEVLEGDPEFGYWGHKLNSFKALGFRLDEQNEGTYRGIKRYNFIPYTEERAEQFYNALMGLSVTAFNISKMFRNEDVLLEGLSMMALPAPSEKG